MNWLLSRFSPASNHLDLCRIRGLRPAWFPRPPWVLVGCSVRRKTLARQEHPTTLRQVPQLVICTSLGANLFGLEDILGGGDRDFDDLVIGFTFTGVS